ncbi:MAG: hypothetical protein ACRERU_00460 [Methylococcales bacterium]
MNEQTQATLSEPSNMREVVLYRAIEMGEKSWKLGFTTDEPKAKGQLKVYQKVIEGNDYAALSEAGQRKRKSASQAGIGGEGAVSCYEAGQDGFWPHRKLSEMAIETRVVDRAELAWSWLRYPPTSALSIWFQKRFGGGGKRQRRIGIVALGRRLLGHLWGAMSITESFPRGPV